MTRLGAQVDLEGLGFEHGAHLLVRRALSAVPVGGDVTVAGRDPALAVHLRAWCRAEGHRLLVDEYGGLTVTRGGRGTARWTGAERAGSAAPGVVEGRADPTWGLAARGA
ncbi:MAG: hypothetical protein J0J00_08220, partial [Microbacterium sp.]|nr:hypothetical protein [Microbacterium sp.]